MALTCIPPLRPLKGWLVSSQYFYKAAEGAWPKLANETVGGDLTAIVFTGASGYSAVRQIWRTKVRCSTS